MLNSTSSRGKREICPGEGRDERIKGGKKVESFHPISRCKKIFSEGLQKEGVYMRGKGEPQFCHCDSCREEKEERREGIERKGGGESGTST